MSTGLTQFFLCQATEIGKAVNRLRKHASKEIRYLARTLIEYETIPLHRIEFNHCFLA